MQPDLKARQGEVDRNAEDQMMDLLEKCERQFGKEVDTRRTPSGQ